MTPVEAAVASVAQLGLYAMASNSLAALITGSDRIRPLAGQVRPWQRAGIAKAVAVAASAILATALELLAVWFALGEIGRDPIVVAILIGQIILSGLWTTWLVRKYR